MRKYTSFINTAHDIRTPLTLIKAPLEELREKEELSKEGISNMEYGITKRKCPITSYHQSYQL